MSKILGRPAVVSDERIVEAGQALVAAGKPVTGWGLRTYISSGNPARLLEVWQAHLAAVGDAAPVQPVELPTEVSEQLAGLTTELIARLTKVAAELNEKAVRSADARVREANRALEEQRQRNEQELNEAAATVDELEAALAASQAEASALRADLQTVQALSQSQAVEIAQLTERLTAAELAGRVAAEQSGADLARARAEALQAATELESVRSTYLAQLDAAHSELASVRAAAESDVRNAQTLMREHQQALQAERRLVEDLRAGLDAERQLTAQAREEVAAGKGRLDALQGELDKQRDLVQALSAIRPIKVGATQTGKAR